MSATKPKKEAISARVDSANLAKLLAKANADDRTLSYLIDKAIAEYLARRENKKAKG